MPNRVCKVLEEGRKRYAIPTVLQESWQFRSCPHVTSHSYCPLSSPGLEQRVASLPSNSHLCAKDKTVDMRVNISLQKCREQSPQIEKVDSRAHPEAMSQHMQITFSVSDMSFCYITHKLYCFQKLPCGVYSQLLS